MEVKKETKKTNKAAIIVIFLFVIALVSGGIYWLQTQKNGISKKNLKEEKVIQEEIDKIADWKIYNNKKYGYSFKYPDDCAVGQRETDVFLEESFVSVQIKDESRDKRNFFIHIGIAHPDTSHFNPSFGANLISWVKDKFSPGIYKAKDIPDEPNLEIDGMPAVKIYTRSPQSGSQSNVYFIRNDKLFHINMMDVDSAGAEEFYDLFLSTFKFEEIDEMSDWKVCRNEKYKVFFLYPGSFDITAEEVISGSLDGKDWHRIDFLDKGVFVKPEPKPSPPAPPPVNGDTSDWKTYRNEEFGFEIRYPEIYSVEDISKKVIGDDPTKYPWYLRTGFALSYIIFDEYPTSKGGVAFSLDILNTTDKDKIESTGGWQSIKESGVKKIGNLDVYLYSIDLLLNKDSRRQLSPVKFGIINSLQGGNSKVRRRLTLLCHQNPLLCCEIHQSRSEIF